ncbi:hypothetical protein KCU98_g22763, partial [Aureobasidium melanogenum]
MRLAEKRLDKFWATVDNHCEVHTSYSVLHLLMNFFSDWNRKIHRTKRWVEPKESDCSPNQQPEDDKDEEIGLPLHVFDPNARCVHPKKSELLGGIPPQKSKAKTRPDGHTPSPMQETRRDSATSTDDKNETEVKKIKVNKRAFKVFSTMFHVPSATEQQNTGEVAWTEFLYSMKTI